MKLAVITPTYNRPELLQRLHMSLAQTGAGYDWWHYVVDDGSHESYAEAIEACKRETARLTYRRIANSGALVARNHAIEMAMADGRTHLCFIDDDDIASDNGISGIMDVIACEQAENWFVFASRKNGKLPVGWPSKPTRVRWFEDIVLDRALGSDNLIVVASKIVGSTRFSTKGRNQREWTFFLDLSETVNEVLVHPALAITKEYRADGLTAQARRKTLSRIQLSNNIERAWRYWRRAPLRTDLFLNFVKQLCGALVNLTFTRFASVFGHVNATQSGEN